MAGEYDKLINTDMMKCESDKITLRNQSLRCSHEEK